MPTEYRLRLRSGVEVKNSSLAAVLEAVRRPAARVFQCGIRDLTAPLHFPSAWSLRWLEVVQSLNHPRYVFPHRFRLSSRLTVHVPSKLWPLRGGLLREFLRHGEIYQSDVLDAVRRSSCVDFMAAFSSLEISGLPSLRRPISRRHSRASAR